NDPKDPRVKLRECGATAEECDFLVARRTAAGWMGERVELNEMTSPQFIDFLERKLQAAGAVKLVPSAEILAAQYQRAQQLSALAKLLDRALEDSLEGQAALPADLAAQVRERIEGTGLSWDQAVWQIVRERTAK